MHESLHKDVFYFFLGKSLRGQSLSHRVDACLTYLKTEKSPSKRPHHLYPHQKRVKFQLCHIPTNIWLFLLNLSHALRTRPGCPLLPLLFSIVLEGLANTKRKKSHKDGKNCKTVTGHTNMIAYVETYNALRSLENV